MTDAEQREAARQFVNRWMGKGKEDEEKAEEEEEEQEQEKEKLDP